MKFVKDFNSFIITETYNQAKDYLIKKDIDLSKDIEAKNGLDYISELFKKNINLIPLFVKFWYEESVPLFLTTEQINELKIDDIEPTYRHSIKDFYDYYHKNKQQLKNYLPKDIIWYTSFESLCDDIDKTHDQIKLKQFISKLPGTLRRDYQPNEEYSTIILTYLDKLEYNEQNHVQDQDIISLSDFYKKSSRFSRFEDMIRFLKKELNNEDDSDYKKEVLYKLENKYKKAHNVVYSENNILVIVMFDKEGIKDLGGTWCIVTNQEAHYDDYVNPLKGWTQYLVFDFNKMKKDPNSLFGISISENGQTKSGAHQNRENNEVPVYKIISDLSLPKDIFKPIYVGLKQKYGDVDITNYSEFLSLMSEIAKDGYGDELKNLIGDSFNFSKFVYNLISDSKSYQDLLGRIEDLDNEIFLTKTCERLSKVFISSNSIVSKSMKDLFKHFEDFGNKNYNHISSLVKRYDKVLKNIPYLVIYLSEVLDIDKYLNITEPFLLQIANSESLISEYLSTITSIINIDTISGSINNIYKYFIKEYAYDNSSKYIFKQLLISYSEKLTGTEEDLIIDMMLKLEIPKNDDEYNKLCEQYVYIPHLIKSCTIPYNDTLYKDIINKLGIYKYSTLMTIVDKYTDFINDKKPYNDISIYKEYLKEIPDISKIYEEILILHDINKTIDIVNIFKSIITPRINKNISINDMTLIMNYLEKIEKLK